MEAVWGIVRNKGGRKWYHVSRIVFVDGCWFELYWHDGTELCGSDKTLIRGKARAQAMALETGVFYGVPGEVTALERRPR